MAVRVAASAKRGTPAAAVRPDRYAIRIRLGSQHPSLECSDQGMLRQRGRAIASANRNYRRLIASRDDATRRRTLGVADTLIHQAIPRYCWLHHFHYQRDPFRKRLLEPIDVLAPMPRRSVAPAHRAANWPTDRPIPPRRDRKAASFIARPIIEWRTPHQKAVPSMA